MQNRVFLAFIFLLLFNGCKREGDNFNEQEGKILPKKVYDLNSIFHDPKEVLSIEYSKFPKVSPERFVKEFEDIVDSDAYFALDDFRTFFFHTNSLNNVFTNSLGIELKNGKLRVYLQLGNPTFENRIHSIHCRVFTKAFRDCKLSFYLEGEEGITDDAFLVIMSKSDRLFMTYAKEHSTPLLFSKHTIDSLEFGKDTIEAYKLYKEDKDAPSLKEYGYSDTEIATFEKKYSEFLKERNEFTSEK